MKGISPVIAAVLVILISITGITLVLTVAVPAIQKAREAALISEARHNMELINSLVQQVASEGVGSLRTVEIKVTEGEYRVKPAGGGLFEFFMTLKSGLIPKGTFLKEGNFETFVGGVAKASQNSTHLILENEILEVVQPKIGSETSFAGINTTTAISTIRLKDSDTTIVPLDTRVIIGNVTNTSWGLGYSKLTLEGGELASAESVFHVRSNLTNVEYEVTYTLRPSADFLLISVRNVSSANLTTVNFGYFLGSVADSSDIIRLGSINESLYRR